MNLDTFLKRVVPDSGAVFIAIKNSGGIRQFRCTSHSTAAKYIAKYGAQTDTYFAVASFNDEAKRRLQTNVKYLKALYVDIDCGASKPYPNKKAGLKALLQFCKSSGIPAPSLIVDSGNGIHAYWTLDVPIERPAWDPLAAALQGATAQHGLEVDPTITTDSARILRPPMTSNHKDEDHPKPVTILYDGKRDYALATLRTALGSWLRPVSLGGTGAAVQANDDLSGGMHSHADYYAKHIVKECGVMKTLHETRGADVAAGEQAFWSSYLHLLSYCADGEQWAHTLSDGYVGYNPRDTQRAFDYKVAHKDDQAPGGGKRGPTRCTTFAGFRPDSCASCKHRGSITSPIVLGLAPMDSGLPVGYTCNEQGVMRKTEEGWKLAIPYRLANLALLHDQEEGMLASVQADIKGRTRTIRFPISSLHDGKALAKHLSRGHMVLARPQMDAFSQLMTPWIQQLQRNKEYSEAYRRFGWLEVDEQDAFIVGTDLYMADGTHKSGIETDKIIADQYSVKGDIAPWQHAADFVLHQCPTALSVMIASAFAAPLMPFTGQQGILISFVSRESGTGKSSAMKVSQAVWGNPRTGINALADTPLSVAKKIGVISNLPAYWDELRIRDDVKSFIRLAFQLGQGKEKSRLTSGATLQHAGQWETLIAVATNEPLIEHMNAEVKGTNAGMVRTFEMTVPDIPTRTPVSVASRIFRETDSNYGHAGRIYAKWLAENKSKADAVVQGIALKLEKQFGPPREERFWMTTITVLLAGATIAKKLGLVDFDLPALYAFLVETFNNSKAFAKAESRNSAHLIYEYCSEFGDYRMVTEFIPTGRGRPARPAVLYPPLRSPLRYQLGRTPATLRIDVQRFKHWLYKQGLSPKHEVDTIMHELGAQSLQSTLGVGTDFAAPGRTLCLDIDLRAAGLSFQTLEDPVPPPLPDSKARTEDLTSKR